MGIYYEDPMVTLYQGDVRDVLRALPAESVQTVVTSPPYWSLRDYGIEPSVWGAPEHRGCGDDDIPLCVCQMCFWGGHEWGETVVTPGQSGGTNQGGKFDNPNGVTYRPSDPSESTTCLRCGAWRGALGLEPTPELFISHMVEVFREVKRVLRRDGTLWLNIGDTYAAQRGGTSMPAETLAGGVSGRGPEVAKRGREDASSHRNASAFGLKHKDMVGIPWMLAFALRADGWWLRQDIIWAKPNPMPESVTDRCTKAHEMVFLLGKAERYYYDADAVREAATDPGRENGRNGRPEYADPRRLPPGARPQTLARLDWTERGRNKRSVWTIATEPNSQGVCGVCRAVWHRDAPKQHCGEDVGGHFATYPQALVRPCVLAGTSECGACSECGAPWERVVETEQEPLQATNNRSNEVTGWSESGNGRTRKHTTTLGWRPTCAHTDAPTVPCTVLDPFSGSGTTALVAKALGRRAVGIDLNAEYLAMSRKRIERVTLPMVLGAV